MTAEQIVEACQKAHAEKGGKMEAIDWASLLAKLKALEPTVLAIIQTIITLFGATPAPAPLPTPPVQK